MIALIGLLILKPWLFSVAAINAMAAHVFIASDLDLVYTRNEIVKFCRWHLPNCASLKEQYHQDGDG